MYAIAQQCVKVNLSLLMAALVTFILFFLMTLLINSDEDRVQEMLVVPIVDARMPDIPVEQPLILEPPEPILEPEVIDTPLNPRVTEFPGIAPPTISSDDLDPVAPVLTVFDLRDSSMIPLSRTTAAYPNRALQQQIEGFVIVSFTVSERGDVINPKIDYAEPEGWFERAALQTIAKWKYAPKIENGKPVQVHGVQQRIQFQIER